MPENKKAEAGKLVLAKVTELDAAINCLVACLNETDFTASGDQSEAESDGKNIGAEGPVSKTAAEADPEALADVEGADEDEEADLTEAAPAEVKTASETDKGGVEETCTQKSLTEVQFEINSYRPVKTDCADADHMLDVAPTAFTINKKYASQLRQATAILDNVATYCEGAKDMKLAESLDKVSDALEKIASTAKEDK
jgi:hypothetical protein